MDMLNQYLRENKIKLTNPELCVNLRTYYRFLHQERDSMKDILHSVCPVLQGMLAYEVRRLARFALCRRGHRTTTAR